MSVGGIKHTANAQDQFRKAGIDPQRCTKLARKLHAHSMRDAYKLTSTRRAIENRNTHINPGALEPRTARKKVSIHVRLRCPLK
eukprot:872093-Pelagomonas_calceolata.AAC.1